MSKSLNKLIVWKKIKQDFLQKMDKQKISPEYTDKALKFISTSIKGVETNEELGLYCAMVEKKYPELKHTIDSFRFQEEEKLDRIISLVVDEIIENDDISAAEELLEKLSSTTSTEDKTTLIKKLHPKEYETSYFDFFKD